MAQKFDICVIGAGPGGYQAAIRAAQLGASVALIEKEEIGGMCLYRGCIPSKSILESIKFMHKIKKSENFGLYVKDVTFDYDLMKKNIERNICNINKGLVSQALSYNISMFKGIGTPNGNNNVEIKLSNGKQELIEYKKLILATGSKPDVNLLYKKKDVLTSEDLLTLKRIPNSVIIVGGNSVGCEIAYIFNCLNVETSIIEKNNILSSYDEEISEKFLDYLENKGISIYINQKINEIAQNKNNFKVILKNREILGAEIIFQTERVANLDQIDTKLLGLKTENGYLCVNDRMETNSKDIYAVGDMTGSCTASEAFYHGMIAPENIMGIKSSLRSKYLPKCVYSFPEVLSVGLSEKEAKERGYKVHIGKSSFTENSRATILNENEGFIKIVCSVDYKEILGIHMIGPKVSEFAAFSALTGNLEATLDSLTSIVYPHPSLSESIKEAVNRALESWRMLYEE